MSGEIKGFLTKVFDVQQVTEKFSKCEFVIQTPDDRYPQTIKMEAQNSYIDLLLAFPVGSFLKIKYDLKGREYQKDTGEVQYFNTAVAWRFENMNPLAQNTQQKPLEQGNDTPPQKQPESVTTAPPKVQANGDDDLPF